MRKYAVAVFVILAAALLMGLAGCSGDEGTATTASSATTMPAGTTATSATTVSTAPTTSSTVPSTTTGPEATTGTSTAGAADDGNWQKVFELSGSGTGEKTSETFELSGAPARISYTVKTDTVWTMAAFVEPEGWDIKTQGGFPDVWESEKTEGSEALDQEAGSHFLYVTAANCDWTVVIEEQK